MGGSFELDVQEVERSGMILLQCRYDKCIPALEILGIWQCWKC